MIELDNIQITSYDISSLTISWEVVDTYEILSDYNINIYRSEDPTYSVSGVELIVSGLDASLYTDYVDYTISGLDITDQWSYRNYFVQPQYETDDSVGEMYGPYHISTTRDLQAKEIIRRHSVSLRSDYGGRSLLVLKRKTNGEHCSDCYDETLGRQTEERCTTCYDTTWVGGYWTPIKVQAMINAAPRRNQITVWGLWEPSDVIVTMGNYPLLSPRDKIVDLNNRRWNVIQVRTVEKGLYTVSQQAQLRLINKGDVIYDFDVSGSW